MIKLSKESIIRIHSELIRKYGGDIGIRDYNLLDASCHTPYQTFDTVELYPDIFDKASKYLTSFAGYQIFIDGNKRIGTAAALTFLYINGYKPTISPEKLTEFVMQIAQNTSVPLNDISEYLKIHFIENEQSNAGIMTALEYLLNNYDETFEELSGGEPQKDYIL